MATNAANSNAQPATRSQRDPRDGAEPPVPTSDSPANPIAVAALLSGNPNPTAEQLAVILGAPLSVLMRNKNSILYAKGKKSAGAVEQVGEVTAMKSALPRPGEVVAFKPTPATLPTRPSPPVQPSSKGKPPPASTPFRVEPFLEALMAAGVGCPQWLTFSAGARLNTVRNFFYQLALISASNAVPSDPLDLVAAIDGACGVPREVTPVGIGTVDFRAWARQAMKQLQIAGVSCNQWINASPFQRQQILQALQRQNLFSFPVVWNWTQVLDALLYECVVRAEPASRNPTDAIRARVTAIANCGVLAGEDKLQQIEVINRAFPEYNGNRQALYRLALARYDECQPRNTGGAWNGEGFEYLDRYRDMILENLANEAPDVLNGEVQGMSRVQWVKQGPFMPATGPDLFDPVQGVVGDCYLIAAMASVAWSRPDALMRISRPAPMPTPDDQRVFQIGGTTVWTNQETPCVILNRFVPIFARGSRLDAQWPGVLEKAFAARSLGRSNRPDLRILSNSEHASERDHRASTFGVIGAMTGGSVFWWLSWFRSDNAFFLKLTEYCDNDRMLGKTRVPICACTYESGGFVDRTGLVPYHAYSVLGWGVNDQGVRFVALRNPWGSSFAGLPHSEYRVPGARLGRLNLDGGDGGCFALQLGAFSAAFSCFYGAE